MKVLCSGLNVVDVLVATPSNVKLGHKSESDKIVIQGGSPACNAACGLSSLGHDTYFLGYLGDNPLSVVAKKELTDHGVKTDFIKYNQNASPAVAVVQIDQNGERTVIYSMENYVPFNPIDLDETTLKGFKLFLVDGYDTSVNLELLKIARKYGIKTVLDMETGNLETMKAMIALSTDPILPLECAQNITGKNDVASCLKELSKYTQGQVIITDGANGSYAIEDGIHIHQPAFKVQVVDTTGCGDAFHAAYASALLQGFQLKERLVYASFFAAQVAQYFGGRTCLSNREFMEQNCPIQVEQ
ncbi:carbohydrate kinase family protein [Pseudotamlana carrageenivorans]|uniref:Ribokinase n=1 Tax=Pseudotamlana carrageenivorans TaxID=2069432 RepID=A0A2I7SJY8_9FLAO|nr:PfkB family carbohydrate kinase [Tamlana carrageenivorans]AUS06218.1 ribokinase [Tamlana carrageenivorans]